ncbi:ATP-binding protein [Alkalihalophilus pseudofirmus]|uniref:ATP-binding protein n=1 Tax=Alkalihalophilus pseudofirmus TaxID=79885 RepID=UPI00259B9B20|nr:ATP-binding protein [Alkalihalophilus pseudofirmus]WEG19059.1 ATP-binding protein [Alkalihalophilus pseudofirmus]
MEPKSGKTTNATKFPNSLLLAFERGYNALNNVHAQPINKWTEFKQVLKQLNNPKVREKYETIIIDTADIAWDLAEQYVLNREGVDKISDIPFGGGYKLLEKEVDQAFRSIPLMDYGLVMISHSEDKQFTDESGQEFNKIVPTLAKKARKIVLRMSDIIGFSKAVETEEGVEVRLYMRGSTRFEAGSRWKHTPNYVPFDYNTLVGVIADAIEKQAEEDKVQAIDGHVNVYQSVTEDRPFEEVRNEATKLCQAIAAEVEEGDERNARVAKIGKIIENHLGKGRNLKSTEEEQKDLIELIIQDLNEYKESL